jgi:hypothetical protein
MIEIKALASELRNCGLERMAKVAESGDYEDRDKIVTELRYALTLKSLRASDIGKIGRLHKRVLDGEFGN